MTRVAASGRVATQVGLTVKTFAYLGNGQNNRQLHIGFQPDLVIVKGGSGTVSAFWKSASMSTSTAAATMETAAAHSTTAILSFHGQGITLGTSSNSNSSGVTYYGVAFRDPTSNFLAYGNYTGDGTSGRAFTTGNFQPALVMVKRDNGASTSVYKHSLLASNTCHRGAATADDATGNLISSLTSTGFTIGNSAAVNNSTEKYDWFAFASSSVFSLISYTGDGTDNRNITGLGVTPIFAWIKISGQIGIVRTNTMIGDLSAQLTGVNPAADGIQSLISDGVQVGTIAQANNNGSTTRLLGWALNSPRIPASSRVQASGRATA